MENINKQKKSLYLDGLNRTIMKQKLLLLMVLLFVAIGHTQDSLSIEEEQRREKNIQAGNPFKKFGYKPKIATLSKGKYLEFHDLDSIVKIGSFSFHVKKKQITGYSAQETEFSEATLRPEIISRWFSPDPLSDEFTSWTPYHFVHNNPINLIDPDGRAAVDPGDYYDKNNNYLGNDGINDNKVYTVKGSSKFNINDFKKDGKYYNNESAYNENNGSGYSVQYKGQTSDVFVTGDTPSDERIQKLHPAIRMKVTSFINNANTSSNTLIRVSQGHRSFAEQDALYAKGRTTGGLIITNAKGGFSNHNFGLAFDVVGITSGKIDYNLNWKTLSTLGKAEGFEWGGDWKSFTDKPHFQNMFNNTIKNLRQIYNSGNTTNGYINIK